MTSKNVAILIPARFHSKRFPGKPLAKIGKKSMIHWVYESCLGLSQELCSSEVFVVTDDDRIESQVHDFGGNVLRVDENVSSGSERIYSAQKRYLADKRYDLILNVQGDFPLLKSSSLERLIHFHLDSPEFHIATLVTLKTGKAELQDNTHKVKVIYSPEKRRCLYFSRAPIPYGTKQYYYHIGVYSYRPHALDQFAKAETSVYEKYEQLEQLRALEMGMTIGAIEVEDEIMGVDIPYDIAKIEEALNEK